MVRLVMPQRSLKMDREAVISDCGRYRYSLFRKWADVDRLPVMWLMLNPSTADALTDDATIRRCIEFSRRWGYGALWVGNLYAWRSTDPKGLKLSHDPEGPENRARLQSMAGSAEKLIAAWGNHGEAAGAEYLAGILPTPHGGTWHLGLTNSGQPKHPLARGKSFIPYTQPLELLGLNSTSITGTKS